MHTCTNISALSSASPLLQHQLQSKKNQPILCYSHCDLPSYPQSSLPWPTLISPLPPPPTPATPPCSASPQEPRCPLIWSDTTTYPRQRSSQRRLSYPRVPVVCSPLSLCSYGSVTIEQSHMGAPLQCLPNPQWSHRNSQHAHCAVCCSFVEPERMRRCEFQL